jgi:hypothetical protein
MDDLLLMRSRRRVIECVVAFAGFRLSGAEVGSKVVFGRFVVRIILSSFVRGSLLLVVCQYIIEDWDKIIHRAILAAFFAPSKALWC